MLQVHHLPVRVKRHRADAEGSVLFLFAAALKLCHRAKVPTAKGAGRYLRRPRLNGRMHNLLRTGEANVVPANLLGRVSIALAKHDTRRDHRFVAYGAPLREGHCARRL